MSTKQKVLDELDRVVSDFLYYSRKGDEDLPVGTIQKLIEDKELTTEDMATEFRKVLEGYLQ